MMSRSSSSSSHPHRYRRRVRHRYGMNTQPRKGAVKVCAVYGNFKPPRRQVQRAPLPAEINKLADETLEAYEAYVARCVISESAREEGRIYISYDEVNDMSGASACVRVLLGLTRLKLKRYTEGATSRGADTSKDKHEC